MRRVIALILLLVPVLSHASVGPFLQCLGKEESFLHKSYITGPIYKLNQKFISKFVSISDIKIDENFRKKACANVSRKSPSVMLLREMINKRSGLFIYKNTQNPELAKNSIEAIYDELPEIFISFLADIQVMLETPKCLIKKIPEIEYFEMRFKYLQTDLKAEELFNDKKKLDKIFNGLNKLPDLINQCKKKKKN